MKKKIIIAGAGVLGASAAYHLAKAGADVTIIDSDEQGRATDAAAGIVCPWLSQRRNQDWYRLAKAGAAYYPSLIKDLELTGEVRTGYSQTGTLSIHEDEAKIAAMEKRALTRRETAPEIGSITRLLPDEVAELFPPLGKRYYGLFVSGGARVDGKLLRGALCSAAVRHGADYVTASAGLLYEGNRVYGVSAGGREIEADTVAVCAGAWAGNLLQPLGIDLGVSFQKAHIVHMEMDRETEGWPVVMPPGNQYLLAFGGGRIAAGTTHENTELFDPRPTAGGMHEVMSKALATAPGLADAAYTETRVGFRPYTPGFLPVIGAVPGWDGLLAANGLGSSGLTTGPYIGSELAKMALGIETGMDLSPYLPGQLCQ